MNKVCGYDMILNVTSKLYRHDKLIYHELNNATEDGLSVVDPQFISSFTVTTGLEGRKSLA